MGKSLLGARIGDAPYWAERLNISLEEARALIQALWELQEIFPARESWIRRVVYRVLRKTVRIVRKDVWSVRGLPELGDYYPYYIVYYSRGKYFCDCYARAWGYKRRKRICTHVGAVILWRKMRSKIVSYIDT